MPLYYSYISLYYKNYCIASTYLSISIYCSIDWIHKLFPILKEVAKSEEKKNYNLAHKHHNFQTNIRLELRSRSIPIIYFSRINNHLYKYINILKRSLISRELGEIGAKWTGYFCRKILISPLRRNSCFWTRVLHVLALKNNANLHKYKKK